LGSLTFRANHEGRVFAMPPLGYRRIIPRTNTNPPPSRLPSSCMAKEFEKILSSHLLPQLRHLLAALICRAPPRQPVSFALLRAFTCDGDYLVTSARSFPSRPITSLCADPLPMVSLSAQGGKRNGLPVEDRAQLNQPFYAPPLPSRTLFESNPLLFIPRTPDTRRGVEKIYKFRRRLIPAIPVRCSARHHPPNLPQAPTT